MSAACSNIACCPPDDFSYGRSPITFFVIGDYGAPGTGRTSVRDLIDAADPDFIITTGDNSYNSDYPSDVGAAYQEWIDRSIFFPAMGNHDWDSGTEAYLAYFATVNGLRYYALKMGPVDFFFLDSDSREPDGIAATSNQALWLKSQLALSQAPWKIVVAHHPPFSSDDTHGSTPLLQWPFAEWDADIVLSGHGHDYERLIVNGFPYIVNGIGGQSLRGFATPITGSLVRYSSKFGAVRVTAAQNRIRFKALSADNEVIDTYTLEK